MTPGRPQADAVMYRRSPFLIIQWEGSALVLIDCNRLRRVCIDLGVVDLLSSLDDWVQETELLTRSGVTGNVLKDLTEVGILEVRRDNSGGGLPTAECSWLPVDLAVQRQSNVGGCHEDRLAADGGSPPAAFKPRPSGPSVALPPPQRLEGALAEALNNRRSVRRYGREALRLEDLSTLLHHSARVTKTRNVDWLGEHVFRPFPTAGARSELEIYVAPNHVRGLAPGAYHYDPQRHDLVHLEHCGAIPEWFNRSVHSATNHSLSSDPPAVLVVCAVFMRTMWKYAGIGLQLIYKDVGCLYQTLYLVATALNIAPCAIGASRELQTAAWLGLDPLVESPVGSFLVGSPESASGRAR